MMNGAVLDLPTAAAFRGELGRMLLALGIVVLVLAVAWAVQEWRGRGSGTALSWVGMSCLGLLGFGAAALISVGLL